MSDNKLKILMQVGVLLLVVGGVIAYLLMRPGYQQPAGEQFPTTFEVSEDGRSIVDTENGFSVAIPENWVAKQAVREGQEVPNAYDLHHERADIICDIEVAHGKNVTGTSATGFLNVYDPGNQFEGRFKDNFQQLEQFGDTGHEYAFIGWTGEQDNIRRRQVYLPYNGYLATVRFAESLDSEAFGRQPVPCITVFNDLVADGISLP